jgi:hypothetical protein
MGYFARLRMTMVVNGEFGKGSLGGPLNATIARYYEIPRANEAGVNFIGAPYKNNGSGKRMVRRSTRLAISHIRLFFGLGLNYQNISAL